MPFTYLEDDKPSSFTYLDDEPDVTPISGNALKGLVRPSVMDAKPLPGPSIVSGDRPFYQTQEYQPETIQDYGLGRGVRVPREMLDLAAAGLKSGVGGLLEPVAPETGKRLQAEAAGVLQVPHGAKNIIEKGLYEAAPSVGAMGTFMIPGVGPAIGSAIMAGQVYGQPQKWNLPSDLRAKSTALQTVIESGGNVPEYAIINSALPTPLKAVALPLTTLVTNLIEEAAQGEVEASVEQGRDVDMNRALQTAYDALPATVAMMGMGAVLPYAQQFFQTSEARQIAERFVPTQDTDKTATFTYEQPTPELRARQMPASRGTVEGGFPDQYAGPSAYAPENQAQPGAQTQPVDTGLQPETAEVAPENQALRRSGAEVAQDFDVSTRTDEQVLWLTKDGKPGWKEAAIAEANRRGIAQPAQPTSVQPSTPVQAAPKARKPSYNLLTRIKQLGGIRYNYLADVTGENKVRKGTPIGLFKKQGGLGLDDLATQLADENFPINLNDPTDTGGVNQLTALIQEALTGRPVLNYYGIEAELSAMPQEAEDPAAIKDAEVVIQGVRNDELDALLDAAFNDERTPNAYLSDDEIDQLFGPAPTTEQAQPEVQETGTPEGSPQAEPFALDAYTADDLKAREVKQEPERPEAPSPAGFLLTGSDRQADELEARGQMPLAQAHRFEIGRSLSKEDRKRVLRTLVDVYKLKGAPLEDKGQDRNGNDIVGYKYSPELFEQSDITGRMVRYYVRLPDGRIAHPTELFPDYGQNDIDAALAKQRGEEEQERLDREARVKRMNARKADTVQEANRLFWAQQRGTNIAPEETILLTNGEEYARSLKENAEKDADALGDGWHIKPLEARGQMPLEAARPAKQDPLPGKLRTLADGMSSTIEDKRRPMTQNPTPKRNREYRSRLHEADNLERAQKALEALAAAHENGTIPDILKGIKTKAAVIPLVHKGTEGGGYYDVIPSREYSNKTPAGVALQQLLEKQNETPEQTATREAREKAQKIEALEERMRFQKIPGFFPTPKALADEMVRRLDLEPGMSVLEPEAGKGDLADAVMATEPTADVTTVERLVSLREILEAKGYKVAGDEFLEHKGQYDRIVMNPPFEKGQDMEHVRHAYDQLKPGGKLVALMSEGSFNNSSKKAAEFRDWLDSVGGVSEKAQDGAFKGVQAFRQTGVNIRIVEIEKPLSVRQNIEGYGNETQDLQGRQQAPDDGRGIPYRGGRGTLLGTNIPAWFQAEKGAVLVGKEARTTEQLAQAAQVLRDPRYETLRIFVVKDGKVVFHSGLTSRAPGEVKFKGGLDVIFADAMEHMRNAGGDGYWLLHNHPSGRATPSQADLDMSQRMAERYLGFLGHVVIDHNEAASIVVHGKYGWPDVNMMEVKSQSWERMPHMVLGWSIKSPETLVSLGKMLQVTNDHFILLARNAQGKVNAIAEFPAAEAKRGPARLAALIRRFARDSGSPNVVAVTNGPAQAELAGAQRSGYLLDMVHTGYDWSIAAHEGTTTNALWGRDAVAAQQDVEQNIEPYGDKRYAELASKFSYAFTQQVSSELLNETEQAMTDAQDLFEQARGGTISHAVQESEAERLAKLMNWSPESIMEVMASGTPEGFRPTDVMGAGLAIARVQAMKLAQAKTPADFAQAVADVMNLLMAVRVMPSEAGRLLGHYGWLQRQGGYKATGPTKLPGVIGSPNLGEIVQPAQSSQAKKEAEQAVKDAKDLFGAEGYQQAIKKKLSVESLTDALGGERGVKHVMDAIKRQGKDLNVNLLLQELSGMADAMAIQAKREANPETRKTLLNRIVNAVMEMFQVSILTGYFTHEVNVLSNLANMTYEGLLLHPVRNIGKKGALSAYNIGHRLLNDVWAVAKYNAFSEMPAHRLAHILAQRDPVLLALMRGGEGSKFHDTGKRYIPGKAGQVIRSVGFVPLGVEDAVFKTVAYRFELARQQAAGEPVNIQAALDFSNKLTFQSKNKLASSIGEFLDNWPILKSKVLFVRTTTALLTRALELVPGPNLLVDSKKIAHGTEMERRDVAARMLVGSVILALIWDYLEDDDDEKDEVGITGYVPVDRYQRALFYVDRDQVALRLGDDQYTLYRYSPLSDFLGIAVGMKKAAKMANEDEYFQATTELAKTFYQAIVAKHYMSGVVESVEFFQQLARYKRPDEDQEDEGKYKAPTPEERILKGVGAFGLSVVIPNTLPQTGDFTDQYKRKARTLEDDLKRRLPWKRDELPILLSASGESVLNPRHLHPLSVNKRHAPKDVVARWQMKLGKGLEPDPIALRNLPEDMRKELLKTRWEWITHAYEDSQGDTVEGQRKALDRAKREWAKTARYYADVHALSSNPQ